MTQQRWIRPAYNYGLALPLFMLLAEFMMACSHGNLGTKSVQKTSQSPPANEQPSSSDEVFTIVEQPPVFPGGAARLGEYIRQNLRYPEAARKAQVQGKAFVSFTVTKEGNIRDVTVLKGLGFGTNEEAIRLTQSMPLWTPGRQSGRPVNVKYNVVVPFQLNSAN